MIFLSTVLACLLIGSGLSAVFLGSGMIVLERGWSMVISGSVVATGGVILLGIAMLLRELRRLPERLADALPETLHPHPLYADDGFAGHPADTAHEDTADGHAGRRPRLDPPADHLAPLGHPAAAPLPEAPAPRLDPIPPDDHTAEPPRAAAGENGADGSSALKIQISVHGNGANGRAEAPPIPPAAAYRTVEESSGRQGRSFWSRFGRTEPPDPVEAEAETNPPPDPVEDADAPAEPTAAERARERLALADTPEPAATGTGAAARADDAPTEPSAQQDYRRTDGRADAAGTPAPGEDESRDEDTARADARPAAGKAATGTEAAAPAAPSIEAEADDAASPADGTGEPAIVGSYRAGGNLYVMYDNGAIEAETPDGIFRFSSLDKLKAYIASGESPALAGERIDRPATGEAATAGAPA